MKLVAHKKIEYKTWRHDYDNGWSFVLMYENNRLADDYFAKSDELFMDGTVKAGCKKYFYSPLSEPKKQIGLIKRPSEFKYFDLLFEQKND